MAQEFYVEIPIEEQGELPQEAGEQKDHVIIPREPEIENWVGVHSLEKIPEQLQTQEHKFYCFSNNNFLSEWTKDHSLEKNRMAVLSVPPGVSNETEALKQLLKKKKYQLPSDPRHIIILLDAKSSGSLSHSFEKVVKKCFPKIEIDNGDQIVSVEKLKEFYQEIKNKSDAKNQYLFVFVGAQSFAEIQPYLPQENCLLPFCQFCVLTCSEILGWESENWTIEKLMLFANSMFPVHFNWRGVYSASELPPKKFKPVVNFEGRYQILSQLVQLFQYRLSDPESRSTLVVFTGVAGVGKTELIKKFLSLDDVRRLFTKIVLIDASEYTTVEESFTICAYNLNFKFGIKTEILNLDSEMPRTFEGLESESGDVARLISMITSNQQVLFVIDGARSLDQIKKYLPNNSHVIVTSRNRDWLKVEDKIFSKIGYGFYRENGFDFYRENGFDFYRENGFDFYRENGFDFYRETGFDFDIENEYDFYERMKSQRFRYDFYEIELFQGLSVAHYV